MPRSVLDVGTTLYSVWKHENITLVEWLSYTYLHCVRNRIIEKCIKLMSNWHMDEVEYPSFCEKRWKSYKSGRAIGSCCLWEAVRLSCPKCMACTSMQRIILRSRSSSFNVIIKRRIIKLYSLNNNNKETRSIKRWKHCDPFHQHSLLLQGGDYSGPPQS